MNSILDPLADLVPAKWRKKVHAVLTLAAVLFGLWSASAGNWDAFLASLVAGLYTASNTANTGDAIPADKPAD